MDNNITKNTYYYLRALPIFAATLVYFIMLRVYPEFVRNLNAYLVHSNPEEQFSQYGWSLYYIIIPFCIAALSRFKRHWLMIIALVIYPIALSISYWLWEMLGWVVMFFALCIVAGSSLIDGNDDKAHSIFSGLSIAVSALYAILRIIGGLGSTHLLGLADIGLVVLIGGYFVVTAIVDVFKFEDDEYHTIVHPAGITLLYLFILSVIMLLMSGDASWNTITLSGADRKKYNNFVLRAEESRNEEHYRYAAYYYTQAAQIRQDKKNTQLAETMNFKADSISEALMRSIPQDLNALRKEKRNSSTFDEHANAIDKSIKILEANIISSSSTSSSINDYKKRLEAQRKRKR